MDKIDVEFCFYDDARYATDADRDSHVLREWHRQLWSKELPGGDRLEWHVEPGGYLSCDSPQGPVRVSSDTIATSHSRYERYGATQLWTDLGSAVRERYDRAFYTVGGFIVFPVRSGSLNQQRGTNASICDRFDLTLECIRQHYVGVGRNPLSEPLQVDADYFRLFGDGPSGFWAYVEFFHLQDLVSGDSIRWLDGFEGSTWDFATPPLPQYADAYRSYLDNVVSFVNARNVRIRQWCDARIRDAP